MAVPLTEVKTSIVIIHYPLAEVCFNWKILMINYRNLDAVYFSLEIIIEYVYFAFH